MNHILSEEPIERSVWLTCTGVDRNPRSPSNQSARTGLGSLEVQETADANMPRRAHSVAVLTRREEMTRHTGVSSTAAIRARAGPG